MAKGGVANVMAKGDGFDKISVETKRAANVASHAAYQLDVETAAREIIVCVKAKYLCFTCESIESRRVHDFFDVA